MIVKYGDAETISVIEPVEVDAEDTKKKMDSLKEDYMKESASSATSPSDNGTK